MPDPEPTPPDEGRLFADETGSSEGRRCGPKPGHGADIHESSGEQDFDGLSGDELPPRKAAQSSRRT